MVEVAVAINMAVSAYNGIKKAVEMGREAEDVAGYFAKFFDAKETLTQASLQNENTPLFKRVFSGKSVESEALEITAAKHKAAKIEKELKEFLIYSGQSQFYDDMMRERRHIRQARIEQVARQAKRKKFWIDTVCIGVLLGAIFVTMNAIIQMLIGAT